MTLGKKVDVGNRSHSLENSPGKRLWTCHKTTQWMKGQFKLPTLYPLDMTPGTHWYEAAWEAESFLPTEVELLRFFFSSTPLPSIHCLRYSGFLNMKLLVNNGLRFLSSYHSKLCYLSYRQCCYTNSTVTFFFRFILALGSVVFLLGLRSVIAYT